MMSGNHNGKSSSTGKALIIASLALVVMALVVTGGVLLAKYIRTGGNPVNDVHAHTFYFTSDMLKPVNEDAAYTLNENVTSISFELRNRGDDLRFADTDIEYNVTVEQSGTSATLSAAAGTLAKNQKSDSTVTLSGLESGKTYVVTAVGTAGYSQTLKATFTVARAETGVFMNLDKSDPTESFFILTVWTRGSITGDAVIAYPNGLIPDNTDVAMRTWQTNAAQGTDAVSFKDYGNSSYTYRFFLDTGAVFADVAIEDFAVTVGGEAAVAKAVVD
ncbi:MAG: hypothetical protein ILO53_07510 [Clostridia bacterium]|nr:hypothetical protein [Clostridia bacterium]